MIPVVCFGRPVVFAERIEQIHGHCQNQDKHHHKYPLQIFCLHYIRRTSPEKVSENLYFSTNISDCRLSV